MKVFTTKSKEVEQSRDGVLVKFGKSGKFSLPYSSPDVSIKKKNKTMAALTPDPSVRRKSKSSHSF